MFKTIVYIKYFFKTGKLAKSVRFTQRYGIAKVNGYFFVYAKNFSNSAVLDAELLEDLIRELN